MTTEQQAILADPEARRTFEEELLFGEVTDTVSGLLGSLGVTQRALADRLGLSEGRVSQILSGGENITLRTLASLGWALGARFEFQPIPLLDRAGTPAQDDPTYPEWVEHLSGYLPFVIRRVDFEAAGESVRAKPKLRSVGGIIEPAA
jgi:transcriptional regulator with XRE-family HTH domain